MKTAKWLFEVWEVTLEDTSWEDDEAHPEIPFLSDEVKRLKPNGCVVAEPSEAAIPWDYLMSPRGANVDVIANIVVGNKRHVFYRRR